MRDGVLAVIPARGGSKAILRKNLQLVAGRPLLAWTIDAALQAKSVDRVVVSTEDDEIAAIAGACGAEIPVRRPVELAGDDTPGIDPVLHIVQWLDANEGYRPELVVILQPTSPLRIAADIDAGIALLRHRSGTALVSVCPAEHPAAWMSPLSDRGVLSDFRPDHEEPSHRQQKADLYAQNGALYVVQREHLLATGSLYAGETLGYVMPPERSLDIDDPWQLAVADALLRGSKRQVAAITIAGIRIGFGAPCFVVAEIGVNHNGDPVLAERLIEAAAASGADAVKLQTWKTDDLVTHDAPLAQYQQTAGAPATQYALLKSLELPSDVLPRLKAQAEALGLIFFSTPDEEGSADLLAALDVPLFKIGSAEITNLQFLRHVAAMGLPMIISTGMATLAEVAAAVDAVESTGNRSIVLLHCVSSYPSLVADANLRAMDTLADAFAYPVGFSDHTQGDEAAMAAVARGAVVVEKHLTLDRTLPGPDHAASLEPDAFGAFVRAIRAVESALGSGIKKPTAAELLTRDVVRKVAVAARPLKAGEMLTRGDIVFRRAGRGISPVEAEQLVGRPLRCDVPEGTPITRDHV